MFAGKYCIYWDNWDGMNPQPWKEGDCGLQALWMNDAYVGCSKDENDEYIDADYAAEYDCSIVNAYVEDNFDFEGDWLTGCIVVNNDGTCAEYECVIGEWTEGAPDDDGYTEWTYTCTYTTASLPTDEPSEDNSWYGCDKFEALTDDGVVTCQCADFDEDATACNDKSLGYGCVWSTYPNLDGDGVAHPSAGKYYCDFSDCKLTPVDGVCPDDACDYIQILDDDSFICACAEAPFTGTLSEDGVCTPSCTTFYAMSPYAGSDPVYDTW